jgi:hypothetical protein
VYPLKFLFTLLVNEWTGAGTTVHLPGGAVEQMIEPEQLPILMAIFSGGYLAVAVVFILLHARALQKRAELQLNDLEVFDTKSSIGASTVNGCVALASIGIAWSGLGSLAGVIYPILMSPGLTLYYTLMGRRRRAMEQRLTATQGA